MGAGGIINQRALLLLGALTDSSYYDSLSVQARARVDELKVAGPFACTEGDVRWMAAVIKGISYGC